MARFPDAILVIPECSKTTVYMNGQEIAFCESCKYSCQQEHYGPDETGCTHQYMALDAWTPRRVKKSWFCGFSEPREKHLPVT